MFEVGDIIEVVGEDKHFRQEALRCLRKIEERGEKLIVESVDVERAEFKIKGAFWDEWNEPWRWNESTYKGTILFQKVGREGREEEKFSPTTTVMMMSSLEDARAKWTVSDTIQQVVTSQQTTSTISVSLEDAREIYSVDNVNKRNEEKKAEEASTKKREESLIARQLRDVPLEHARVFIPEFHDYTPSLPTCFKTAYYSEQSLAQEIDKRIREILQVRSVKVIANEWDGRRSLWNFHERFTCSSGKSGLLTISVTKENGIIIILKNSLGEKIHINTTEESWPVALNTEELVTLL